MRILALSLQRLEFWPYQSKHGNSGLIYPNIRILALSVQTLELWPYLSKHWNSGPIFPNTGILTLLFQTFQFRISAFQVYEFRVSLSDECLYISILALSLQRLEFLPYLSKH